MRSGYSPVTASADFLSVSRESMAATRLPLEPNESDAKANLVAPVIGRVRSRESLSSEEAVLGPVRGSPLGRQISKAVRQAGTVGDIRIGRQPGSFAGIPVPRSK